MYSVIKSYSAYLIAGFIAVIFSVYVMSFSASTTTTVMAITMAGVYFAKKAYHMSKGNKPSTYSIGNYSNSSMSTSVGAVNYGSV